MGWSNAVTLRRWVRSGVAALAGLVVLTATAGGIIRSGVLAPEMTVEEAANLLGRPVALRPLRSLSLTTDPGRRVRTYEFTGEFSDGLDPAKVEALFQQHWGATHQFIRRTPPDPTYNCHGWTFARGRCWVQSDEAEAILRENRYRPSVTPHDEDVVAYLDAAGRVCHSGVVIGLSRDGEAMVESKWGWLGRYVHPVEVQPYAGRWVFYRSDRTGHDLVARPSKRPDSTVAVK